MSDIVCDSNSDIDIMFEKPIKVKKVTPQHPHDEGVSLTLLALRQWPVGQGESEFSKLSRGQDEKERKRLENDAIRREAVGVPTGLDDFQCPKKRKRSFYGNENKQQKQEILDLLNEGVI